MSYLRVIRHIESILNSCGDPVRFTPTGRTMLDQTTMHMAVEVMKVDNSAHQRLLRAAGPAVSPFAARVPARGGHAGPIAV